VGRFPERAPELAAEVRPREAGGAGEVVDVERLGVAGVRQVLGAEQVPGGRDEGHRRDNTPPEMADVARQGVGVR
jgi:hypothetical protein